MKLLALILIFSIGVVHAARDPKWMIQIEKQTESGETITGTGYIVKISGKYFVRTASHITLGNTENVRLLDNRGREVSFSQSNYAVDNSHDDMIIELNGDDHDQLGTWVPNANRYVIDKDTYKKFRRHSNRQYVEKVPFIDKKYSSAIVSPRRVDRDGNGNYELDILGTTDSIDTHYNDENVLRESQIPGVKVADFNLLPGESGTPVIGFDIGPDRSNQSYVFPNELRDEQGNLIEVDTDHYLDLRYPYIKGHALNNHRTLKSSKFLSETAFSTLQDFYLAGNRGSVDEVEWKYENGLTYRTDGNIDESSTNGENTGNGTGVDTGNGTGVDTGNGTGVDTGNGTGVDTGNGNGHSVMMGMKYQGRQVLAFELSPEVELCEGNRELERFIASNGHIAANWLNYDFIRQLKTKSAEQLLTPVETADLGQSILNRLVRNDAVVKYPSYVDFNDPMKLFQFYYLRATCVINKKELMQNKLKLKVHFTENMNIELIEINQDINSINLLHNYTTQRGTKVEVDLTSVFGVDISSLGHETEDLKDIVYITLRSDELRQTNLNCSLGDEP